MTMEHPLPDDLVELNLEAGKRARAAFANAAALDYFERGLALLGDSPGSTFLDTRMLGMVAALFAQLFEQRITLGKRVLIFCEHFGVTRDDLRQRQHSTILNVGLYSFSIPAALKGHANESSSSISGTRIEKKSLKTNKRC